MTLKRNWLATRMSPSFGDAARYRPSDVRPGRAPGGSAMTFPAPPVSVAQAAARAQPLGCACRPPGPWPARLPGRDEPGTPGAACVLADRAVVPRSLPAPRLRRAHHAAHVGGAWPVAAVHLHLRDARREEPAGRAAAPAAARHSAVGADPRLLSFTVVFFMGLFPGSLLGAEFAAIFAIFTSQAWNMAFSFYQSLRTVPSELLEASRIFRLSPWLRFWRLEVPFAMPQPHLEHDDVDVGRLVLRRRLGSDHRRRHDVQAARHRLLPRPRDRAAGPRRGRLGGRHHAGGDPALRPAAVPAARRLGRQVPLRADGGRSSRRSPGSCDVLRHAGIVAAFAGPLVACGGDRYRTASPAAQGTPAGAARQHVAGWGDRLWTVSFSPWSAGALWQIGRFVVGGLSLGRGGQRRSSAWSRWSACSCSSRSPA